MKKAINEAKDWLVRAEKHPVCTVNGWWRWVLPDPGDSDAMEELPEPVFKRLIGDPEIGTHTWLFMTRERAMVGRNPRCRCGHAGRLVSEADSLRFFPCRCGSASPRPGGSPGAEPDRIVVSLFRPDAFGPPRRGCPGLQQRRRVPFQGTDRKGELYTRLNRNTWKRGRRGSGPPLAPVGSGQFDRQQVRDRHHPGRVRRARHPGPLAEPCRGCATTSPARLPPHNMPIRDPVGIRPGARQMLDAELGLWVQDVLGGGGGPGPIPLGPAPAPSGGAPSGGMPSLAAATGGGGGPSLGCGHGHYRSRRPRLSPRWRRRRPFRRRLRSRPDNRGRHWSFSRPIMCLGLTTIS
jgi:hypothetical protein